MHSRVPIVSVLARRWPSAEVYLFPSTVQGADAPTDLVAALSSAARFSETATPLDALIIGRGGGSSEDLAAFSEELVVRAVAAGLLPNEGTRLPPEATAAKNPS